MEHSKYNKMRPSILKLIFLLMFLPPTALRAEVEDAFSPNQGATMLVVRTIAKAKKTLDVAAYSFTSKPIADALVAAHNRGVDVEVVLDKSQRSIRSKASFLIQHGIPTRFNDRYAIMHDKFLIVDGKILELGSFNYTKAAEQKNAENVLVIHRNHRIITDYKAQWQKLWDEGQPE